MWAAAEGNTAAVDVLLEAGADLKLKSNGGFTPLLFAVRNAHIETTVALLKRGANVNDVAPDGSSALSIASGERLLRAGIGAARSRREPEPARPARVAAPHRGVAAQARRRRRRRRRQHARRVRRSRPARSRPFELATKLLEHGANPNTRVEWNEPRFGKEGGTARNPPNIRLGRHLLSYRGATPFYVAAKNGDIELMRLLVEFKADPTITTLTGITPLMVAAGLDTGRVRRQVRLRACPKRSGSRR